MGWWEQIQNPEKIRKTKTSYGQDVGALNKRYSAPATETTTKTNKTTELQSNDTPQPSVRSHQEPVVPGMDKYSIATERHRRSSASEVNKCQPQKNTRKPQVVSASRQMKEETIELVCQNCRYKVAVRGDLKLKIIKHLQIVAVDKLYSAMMSNKDKFKCTKCKSKNVHVVRRWI